MNTKATTKAAICSLTFILVTAGCMDMELEPEGRVGSSAAALGAPSLTVVAWSDMSEIKAKAYCTVFQVDPQNPDECTCAGFNGNGRFYASEPTKCTMCTYKEWPCTVAPDDSTVDVDVTLFSGGNDETVYMTLDQLDRPQQTQSVQLGCSGPHPSAVEFAVVRPANYSGVAHINGQGGFALSTDCSGN